MPEPRCPFCNVQGINQVEARPVGEVALILYCKGCGAIHGVLPVAPKNQPQPKSEPAPETVPEIDTSLLPSKPKPPPDQKLTPAQAYAMQRNRPQGTVYKHFPANMDPGAGDNEK